MLGKFMEKRILATKFHGQANQYHLERLLGMMFFAFPGEFI